MIRTKIISILFILFGLTAILYSISILSLYYFTDARYFKEPGANSIHLYYNWIRLIDELANIWGAVFIAWVPLILVISFFRSFEMPKMAIWFSGIAFTISVYILFGSRIGVEWWNEYALMVHQLITNRQT